MLEASVRLPAGGAVTGWAACRLHGAFYLDGLDGHHELPVPLVVGARGPLRPSDGVRVLRELLRSDECVLVAGIPCTTPERATYDAARLAGGLRPAVRALDMAFAGEITSRSRMNEFLDGRSRVALVVRRAMRLCSERSLSPPESDLRLIWELDAGLPSPLVNWRVLDVRGRFLGMPDLFDPTSGLAVEYDGAEHRSRRRHAADVDRESDLRDAGCELVRVVAPNMCRPDRLVERLVAARGRALDQPPEVRRWALDRPGMSLDERLAARETAYPQWLDDPF